MSCASQRASCYLCVCVCVCVHVKQHMLACFRKCGGDEGIYNHCCKKKNKIETPTNIDIETCSGGSVSPRCNYSSERCVRSSNTDVGRQKQKRSRTHNNLHYLRVTHEDAELLRVARRYLAGQSTPGEMRLLYGGFTRSGWSHECCRPHAHYCVLRL